MNKAELIIKAKALLKANPELKEIFIIEGTVHMYSKKENAVIQAGGDESKVELVTLEEVTDLKTVKSDTPDATWTNKQLAAYAAEKGIVLDGKEIKETLLNKIAAAVTPA